MLTASNAACKIWPYVKSGFFSSYHTAGYMHGTKFKQLFHARSQIATAHAAEVVEGEEVKVLSQVTGQDVKLVQNSEVHTHTHTQFLTFEMITCFKKETQQKAESHSLAKRQVLKRFFM